MITLQKIFLETSNKVLEVINQYIFWNFYINHVGNIQWRAEYCVSDWNILRLHLKNFNTEKKNPIGIRIFLVNYWNNSIEDYFFIYYWKISSPMYWKITIFFYSAFFHRGYIICLSMKNVIKNKNFWFQKRLYEIRKKSCRQNRSFQEDMQNLRHFFDRIRSFRFNIVVKNVMKSKKFHFASYLCGIRKKC